MSGITKILPVVPVDPITTKALAALPTPVRTVVNPAGPLLRKTVGDDTARALMDPLQVSKGDPDQLKQQQTLLGE